jgi:hypothetical protein
MELTSWNYAMLAIAPFMRGKPMLRTWVALSAASFLSWHSTDLTAWIAIDAIAAAIVVSRPANLPQKLIGALFVCMVLFDLGFYLSPQADSGLFIAVCTAIGWLQWAVLAGWTGNDAWRRFSDWNSVGDRPPDTVERHIR